MRSKGAGRSAVLSFIVFLAFFLFCLAAPALTPAAPPKSVKIGITAPLTGPAAEAGVALKQGFILAMEEWNAKGGVMLK